MSKRATLFRGCRAICGLTLLIACEPTKPAVFASAGFAQPNDSFRVGYRDSHAQRVMSEEWRLDNYYTDTGGALVQKTGDIYESEFEFDLNDDGTFDTTQTLPTYDLRFAHLRTAGLIWIRSIPVSQFAGGTALDVFLQEYLDAIAGAGYEVAKFGRNRRVAEKRYAPKLMSSARATVAGKEALASIIEIANVDEVQVSPNARRQRVKLVLIRPLLTYPVSTEDLPLAKFPVILVAGYANQPDYFEQNLADFDALLARIEMDGVTGYKETPNAASPP